MNPPLAILRSRHGGIYSLGFGPAGLLSGGCAGEVCLWDLQEHRAAWTWKASSQTVLSVQCFQDKCLVQCKDGRVKLIDLDTQVPEWEVVTGSCSFCRVLPHGPGASQGATFCSPLSEPEDVGIFDARAPSPQCGKLLASRMERSPGMCMDLSHCPAVGPCILATYESSDLALWDLRRPDEPLSYLSGDPSCPAICSVVLWRKAWVSCAGGQLKIARLKEGLQWSSAQVQVADAPYQQPNEAYHTEKQGINAMAVRPDLRLVVAARWDRRVELFDGKTATSLNRLVCHDDAVLCASFDGGLFATGGADGRIALWKLFADSYVGPVEHAAASSEKEK